MKKLDLTELKVKSFVTEPGSKEINTIKGGRQLTLFLECEGWASLYDKLCTRNCPSGGSGISITIML